MVSLPELLKFVSVKGVFIGAESRARHIKSILNDNDEWVSVHFLSELCSTVRTLRGIFIALF